MRVVADSHALIWYLFDDAAGKLTPTALDALVAAEAGEGIAVSVASLIDLWYVTQTTGALRPEQLVALAELLADPGSALDAVPVRH